MTIQVNSDKTVAMDASLVQFVEGEVRRILEAASPRITRVEVHLSDVNSRRTGPPDKRCLVEVRPAGARPISTTAIAKRFDVAIGAALKKMRRSLSSSFARQGRAGSAASSTARPGRATRTSAPLAPKTAVKTAAKKAKKPAAKNTKKPAATSKSETSGASSRGPKKKAIFQARRKAWPVR